MENKIPLRQLLDSSPGPLFMWVEEDEDDQDARWCAVVATRPCEAEDDYTRFRIGHFYNADDAIAAMDAMSLVLRYAGRVVETED